MNDHIQKKKICITGGHLTPALAIIEEMQGQKKPWDIIFVGRERTSRDSNTISEEKRVIENEHIRFIPIHAGRITRYLSFSTLVEMLNIPIGFFEACWFCLKYRPDCIVSFGGYVGLPVVIAGWLFGIPVIIHEQTHHMGLANAVAALFADKVLLTFPASGNRSTDPRSIVTGLPLRKSFFHPPKKAPFSIPGNRPIIYITGGTTGAVSLNEIIFPIIPQLVQTHFVIHQTGNVSLKKAVDLKAHLPENMQKQYMPVSYIDSDDVSWIMHHMDVLVGRSGANTTVETATLGKSAVFIPLPWAGNQEQTHNALWYRSLGNAVVMDQRKINASHVYEAIMDMVKKKSTTGQKETSLIDSENAATSVVNEIASVIPDA